MKNNIISLTCIIGFACTVSAQNVGIDVPNPTQKLHIRKDSSQIALRLDSKKSVAGFNTASSIGVPSSVANQQAGDNYFDWIDLDYTKLESSDDIRLSSPEISGLFEKTDILEVYFDFANAIPADADITNISINVEWLRDGPSGGSLNLLDLYLQQASTGDSLYAFGIQYITAQEDVQASINYNELLLPITPNMINSGDIYVALHPLLTYTNGGTTLEIDQLTLQIEYQVPAVGNENVFWTAGVNDGSFVISNSANMTNNLNLAIDENGVTQLKGIKMTRNAGAGKVMMSTDNGRGYWSQLPNNNVSSIDDLVDAISNEDNLFVGAGTDQILNTGTGNTGIGPLALNSNTTGLNNTVIGKSALSLNDKGNENTAVGANALLSNKANSRSTAVGYNAMFYADNNSVGGSTFNTAVGVQSLFGSSTAANNTGKHNTALGDQALYNNTSGNWNTAIGSDALHHNKAKSRSTAIGYRAMFYADSGSGESHNTAIGYSALEGSINPFSNTGTFNTAIGDVALQANLAGSYNTALGAEALTANTTGSDNVATGYRSLQNNKGGSQNTGVGVFSLYTNTNGTHNTGIGYLSLYTNVTGNFNTAIGNQSLESNNTGISNTAVGGNALESNANGDHNTAVGRGALLQNISGSNNTAIGSAAGQGDGLEVFEQCTFIGSESYPTSTRTNVTTLGYGVDNSLISGNNQLLLGNTAVTEIRAQVGSLTVYSDERIKFNIEEDVVGLDFINDLRPVTYYQNPELLYALNEVADSSYADIDHSQIKETKFIGLLAQEVEAAANASGFDFPGIEIPEGDQKAYMLRYGDLIMPMIKAIQELHEENTELKKENQDFKQTLLQMQSDINKIKNTVGLE